jgi:hypothetical protein
VDRPANLRSISDAIRNGVPPASCPKDIEKDAKAIWEVIEICWKPNPLDRLTVVQVAEAIKSPTLLDLPDVSLPAGNSVAAVSLSDRVDVNTPISPLAAPDAHRKKRKNRKEISKSEQGAQLHEVYDGSMSVKRENPSRNEPSLWASESSENRAVIYSFTTEKGKSSGDTIGRGSVSSVGTRNETQELKYPIEIKQDGKGKTREVNAIRSVDEKVSEVTRTGGV